MDKSHSVDSTRSQAFGDEWDIERTNTVPHHNSVFHDLLKRIPWSRFDQLVDQHQADKHVRSLSTKSQLIAMLYAQFSGASSLREIAGGLASHQSRLYHLGGGKVCRSTLSDANALRPSAVFLELFMELVKEAGRGRRLQLTDNTYLIDSTSLRLSGAGSAWAHFSHMACGAKAHIIYDAAGELPIYASVTAAKVNDITAAKAMPIEPGATYVFALGYYDYGWWAQLDKQNCRIVTRFKKNTPLKVSSEHDVPEAGNILSDRIGHLPARGENITAHLNIDRCHFFDQRDGRRCRLACEQVKS